MLLEMPDALSKTVPIWCTVLNRVLFPDQPCSHQLRTPPDVVSPSEHQRITALLPEFVTSLRELGLEISALSSKLGKPLRPLWISPCSFMPSEMTGGIFDEYRPVICCTASRRLERGELAQDGYIQGAGDDSENWAMGLTPLLFWKYSKALLCAEDQELGSIIQSYVNSEQCVDSVPTDVLVEVGPGLFVCPLSLMKGNPSPHECRIILSHYITPPDSWVKSPQEMNVGLGVGKAASRRLRGILSDIVDFVQRLLSSSDTSKTGSYRLTIACHTGKDLSVGVALAILCTLFDENNQLRLTGKPHIMSKKTIKAKLAGITMAYPDANPTGATLQSVTSCLMDWT